MNYQIIYDPIAFTEYKDAIQWYSDRSLQAAENFVLSVDDRMHQILKDPFRFRNTYAFFRETSLKKFPFYIVYFVDEKRRKIIITSIYHHKRNPAKKYLK
jgi:plasmid stabilization system protein ParE